MVRTLMGRVNRPINASTGLVMSGATGTPSYGTFTRATSATYVDPYGTVTTVGNNVARYNNSEYVGTNLFLNPRMAPVAVGQSFSPPTVSGWSTSLATGLFTSVVGKGFLDNGAPYVDIRLFGPNTSGTTLLWQLYPNGGTYYPAVQGDVFTISGYFQVIAGTIPSTGGAFLSPGFDERTGGAHFFYNFSTTGISSAISTTMQRITRTVTVASASIDLIQPGWWFSCNAGVTDVDVTFRFGGAQFEKSSTASTLSLPPSGTFAASTNFTGNRLEIEAARTNSIRNPRAEGAAGGSPGTVPTNWFISIPTGLTQTIATGTENGLTYTEFSFVGTATSSQAIVVGFDSSTAIPALTGQTWSASLYTRLVSGSFGALTTRFTIAENDAGGVFVAGANYTVATPTTFGRVTAVRPLTGGGTVANVQLSWGTSTIAISDVISVAFRLYGPQLELGNQPTSLILPTAGVPAASTRNADILDIPTVGLLKYNGTASNLALQSQTFDNATWVPTAATVTANAIAGPESTVTADKVIPTATTANHGLTQTISGLVAGQWYTQSVFAKAAEFSFVRLGTSGGPFGPSNSALYVDLSTGTMSQYTPAVSTSQTYQIIALSSSWYRITLSTLCTTSGADAFNISVGNVTGFSTTGDGVGGLYLWGAQYEVGQYATASATTLAAPSTPRNKLAAGTIVAKTRVPFITVGSDLFGIFMLTAGSTSNRLSIRYALGTTSLILAANNVGTPSINFASSGVVANVDAIVAATWDDTGVSGVYNGGAAVSTAMPMPTGVTTLSIGQASPGLTVLNGEVSYVTYYPYRMSTAQMQAVTV